ncbi:7441_t:CDS:2, partial [Acaulospora morrowiae]
MASQRIPEHKTFSNQHKLPKLPVPSLEETIAKYLKSLRPLLSDADFARNESYAKDFLKPNGLGKVLQQRLLDVDRIAPHNWLDDTWWIKKAYLEWRVSLAVNSNWYFLFIDDANTPREYFTANNGIRSRGKFSEFQIKRSAHLIGKMLEYKDLLDSERIPPDVTRAYPLCMHQYTRLYGYTRIPQHSCDALPFTPHPVVSRHVLVMVRDQFYILEGYDKSGLRLSDGDYERQLWDIVSDVEKAQLDPPVGVLTADDRDSWTVARERLLSISPQNRETLTLIENALFAISLDDYATGMDLDKWVCNVFYGLNCHNRWFDKAMSIVVESNGRAGMNGEHSPCDALIPSFITNYIVQEPTSLNAQLSGR